MVAVVEYTKGVGVGFIGLELGSAELLKASDGRESSFVDSEYNNRS